VEGVAEGDHPLYAGVDDVGGVSCAVAGVNLARFAPTPEQPERPCRDNSSGSPTWCCVRSQSQRYWSSASAAIQPGLDAASPFTAPRWAIARVVAALAELDPDRVQWRYRNVLSAVGLASRILDLDNAVAKRATRGVARRYVGAQNKVIPHRRSRMWTSSALGRLVGERDNAVVVLMAFAEVEGELIRRVVEQPVA